MNKPLSIKAAQRPYITFKVNNRTNNKAINIRVKPSGKNNTQTNKTNTSASLHVKQERKYAQAERIPYEKLMKANLSNDKMAELGLQIFNSLQTHGIVIVHGDPDANRLVQYYDLTNELLGPSNSLLKKYILGPTLERGYLPPKALIKADKGEPITPDDCKEIWKTNVRMNAYPKGYSKFQEENLYFFNKMQDVYSRAYLLLAEALSRYGKLEYGERLKSTILASGKTEFIRENLIGNNVMFTLRYPSISELPEGIINKEWSDKHTDLSTISVLPQASAEGLIVYQNKEWVHAVDPSASENNIVVLVGDVFELITKGMPAKFAFKPTLHGVEMTEENQLMPRMAMPYFGNLPHTKPNSIIRLLDGKPVEIEGYPDLSNSSLPYWYKRLRLDKKFPDIPYDRFLDTHIDPETAIKEAVERLGLTSNTIFAKM